MLNEVNAFVSRLIGLITISAQAFPDVGGELVQIIWIPKINLLH